MKCARAALTQPSSAAALTQPGGQAAEAALARVLQAAASAADRHAHLAGLSRHAQLGEQLDQQRIRAFVMDNEAGIDRDRRAGGRHDEMGIGVTSQPAVGLKERHVISM